MSFNDLKEKYRCCATCTSSLTDTKVFGYGNESADICVIGEGPGREECEKSIPFVGPAGQLLDKILAGVKIKREDCYFTNTVICRTNQQNRTPTHTEMSNCKKRLWEELSILRPKVTLLVGSPALQCIFGRDQKITREHGEWITLLEKPCYFYFPIYHPAYIMHSSTPGEEKNKKEEVWTDIKKFKRDLNLLVNLDL